MGYFVKLFTKLSNDIFEWKFVRGLSYKLGNLQNLCGLVFMLLIMIGISFFNVTDIHFGDF